MKKETKEFFICDYCGTPHENEEWMKLHEEICPLNPKNQPCAICQNLILGMGCSKGVNMESVNGKNILCFYYKKGIPKNLFTMDFGGDDK